MKYLLLKLGLVFLALFCIFLFVNGMYAHKKTALSEQNVRLFSETIYLITK